MAMQSLLPAGDFRTSYAADTVIFPTAAGRYAAIATVALLCFAPLVLSQYWLSILIQIGYLAIAALGLNILVGFTGQGSMGARPSSARRVSPSAFPQLETVGAGILRGFRLAAVVRAALVGLIFGFPLCGSRAFSSRWRRWPRDPSCSTSSRVDWLSGEHGAAIARQLRIFSFTLRGDRRLFYVVLVYLVLSFVLTTNLVRTHDGARSSAVRDHSGLSRVIGINLTNIARCGSGLRTSRRHQQHALRSYQEVVSDRRLHDRSSILFLAMVIIGGLGFVIGTLIGTTLVVLCETIEWVSSLLHGGPIDRRWRSRDDIAFLEIAIGLVIVFFLVFSRTCRPSLATIRPVGRCTRLMWR